MLPLTNIWDSTGSMSYFGNRTASNAIRGMFTNKKEGRECFIAAARAFASQMYLGACGKSAALYFLDKTPRYYYIIDDIAEIFPESKFIFLHRNPIAILASMMNAWGRSGFNHMHAYIDDLIQAPLLMHKGWEMYKERSVKIHYEDLVTEPRQIVEKITQFLEVKFETSMLDRFWDVELSGELGDSLGREKYAGRLAMESLTDWKNTINTSFRRLMAQILLRRIGSSTLQDIGYQYDQLSDEIKKRSHEPSYKQMAIRRTALDASEILWGLLKLLLTASVYRESTQYKAIYSRRLYLQ